MLPSYKHHIVESASNDAGHIQISQVPDRHEPSDDGTINFTSFFKKVKEIGYDGWVAGEYHAAGERLNVMSYYEIYRPCY